MKIDRLIGILSVLLQQEKITAPELAERFEVSRRTINRDTEDLRKAGIPIRTIIMLHRAKVIGRSNHIILYFTGRVGICGGGV